MIAVPTTQQPSAVMPARETQTSLAGGCCVRPKNRTIEVTIKPRRDLELFLEVDPRLDDLGRYVEPNRVWLKGGTYWIGKRGAPINPEPDDELAMGFDANVEWGDEINEAVTDAIARRIEHDD